MKKFIVFLGMLLILSGCGNSSDKSIAKDLKKKVESVSAYRMKGTLEIYRNEEKYTYDVDSSYQEEDLFKVNLVNQNNNHEQIILKNSSGVYVITPTLNKSFKFQSDWPYNNSQIYLLQPIITDLNNDNNLTVEKTNDGYILSSKVNYSSEKDFDKQKVYLDKDKNILKVEVLDKDGNVKMLLTIKDIDYKAKFDKNYFDAENYVKVQDENSTTESNQKDVNKETTTSKIEEVVYPMYVPVDTYLSGQDTVKTNGGERVILTFGGESAFTIVQETLNDEKTMNYVYGDPYLILDTVGSITDYSVSWISNGVEYSVMSDTMDIDELLTVAQSISVKAVSK
jgi:outer membrane lipoprotein-sorting protein